MPPQAFVIVVGTHHHGHGIPANQRAYAALHKQIARHRPLVRGGDSVAKWCRNRQRQWYTGIFGVLGQGIDQGFTSSNTALAYHRVEGIEPFLSFLHI